MGERKFKRNGLFSNNYIGSSSFIIINTNNNMKTTTKTILFIIYTIYFLAIFILIFLNALSVNSQTPTNPPDKQSILITNTEYHEVLEWEDVMTASVPENECHACQKYNEVETCQNLFNLCK